LFGQTKTGDKMKTLRSLTILLIFVGLISSQGMAQEKRGRGGPKKGAAAKGGHSEFPAYPARQAHSPRIPVHNDSLGNRVTQDHVNRVDFAHGRAETLMRKNEHVTDVVRVERAHFVNVYRPEFEQRNIIFNRYIGNYNALVRSHPRYLGFWHSHFFYGGFYYGFHPVLDIDTYFYNPMVYWFYAKSFDDQYYRNWYQTSYEAYPKLQKPFEYHGLYYPTENLRLLLFGVSAMPVEKQVAFRDSVEVFTKKLAQNLADNFNTHVKLAKGDISITHYEILGYDDAIVLEGAVIFNGNVLNFKGFLDLSNPGSTKVVAPISLDKEPTADQIKRLDDITAQVDSIKGEPSQPQSETPTADAMSSGEVTADPTH
jgi:hypothetical protein